MFKTLKKLMGLSSPVSVTEDVAEAKQKIKNAEKITTVTVTPKKTKTVNKGETKASLGKMTKKDIDDLAKEKFGVELDRRLTKDKMVTAFLSAQKKAK
tara:strand:+ start:2968 stop:3261 length:294 start_codon:yes stop_codon:yes gene_type:complete